MVTVILCVFLLSYMYGEGKSNYFKGSILILSYFVVVLGFYLAGFDEFELGGMDPVAEYQIQSMSFKTHGRGKKGVAY
jgi:Ca2+:H+ antiporter